MAPPERRRIDDTDIDALVAVMDELSAAGGGWINIVPVIPDDVAVPPPPGPFAVFSKRGPAVPLGTWTSPTATRQGLRAPSEIGVQHGQAMGVGQILVEHGLLPPGWHVLQDHARRGLVLRLPDGSGAEAAARFLLGAIDLLCIPPRTNQVELRVYRPT